MLWPFIPAPTRTCTHCLNTATLLDSKLPVWNIQNEHALIEDSQNVILTLVPGVCSVASIVGASLVFPGASSLEFGQLLSSPPFLTGLGPIFLTWLCAPWVTIILILSAFLGMRSVLFRDEDPFHRVLWVLASVVCYICILCCQQICIVPASPLNLHGTAVGQRMFWSTNTVCCIV